MRSLVSKLVMWMLTIVIVLFSFMINNRTHGWSTIVDQPNNTPRHSKQKPRCIPQVCVTHGCRVCPMQWVVRFAPFRPYCCPPPPVPFFLVIRQTPCLHHRCTKRGSGTGSKKRVGHGQRTAAFGLRLRILSQGPTPARGDPRLCNRCPRACSPRCPPSGGPPHGGVGGVDAHGGV